MQNFVRLIAVALFATAGYGWWQSAQLPTPSTTDDYSSEELQASLAELLPGVDFDAVASGTPAASDGIVSLGGGTELGEAEIFNGIPRGIEVPTLDSESIDVELDATVRENDASDTDDIFESIFSEEASPTVGAAATGSENPTTDAKIDETNDVVSEEPQDSQHGVNQDVEDQEIVTSEEMTEDAETAVVFGESSPSIDDESDQEAVQSETQDESIAGNESADKGADSNIVPVVARKQAVVRWDQKYRTTAGRPFETQTVGTGNQTVMVIGSLYGTEPNATLLMDRLLHNLSKNIERYPNQKFVLIRSGNPDGRDYRVAGNIRGVILDQNFSQHSDVKQVGTNRPRPELETLTLMKLMSEYKPRRVVHLRTSNAKVGKIQFTSQDEAIAAFFKDFGGFTIDDSIKTQPKTSLAGYVSSTIRSPVVTVTMPVSRDINSSWMKHRATLLTVLQELKPPHYSPPVKDKSEIDLNDGPFAEGSLGENDDVVPFGESKVFDELDPTTEVPEVEFLPPPPQASRSRNELETAGVEELPPPPEKN